MRVADNARMSCCSFIVRTPSAMMHSIDAARTRCLIGSVARAIVSIAALMFSSVSASFAGEITALPLGK